MTSSDDNNNQTGNPAWPWNDEPPDAPYTPIGETVGTENWPWFLKKAEGDPFFYACGLRSGAIVYFEEAKTIEVGWVRLVGIKGHTIPAVRQFQCPPDGRGDAFTFERGIEVRLDEIIWVADAPYGS